MAPRLTEYEIAPAHWPEDIDQARALMGNYGRFLTASPVGAAGLCLIGYDAELRNLPGKYADKEADLLLARVKGEGAGCVAITERTLEDGMPAAEMKHGPIALINEGMPVVFVATRGVQYDKVISNIEEVRARFDLEHRLRTLQAHARPQPAVELDDHQPVEHVTGLAR